MTDAAPSSSSPSTPAEPVPEVEVEVEVETMADAGAFLAAAGDFLAGDPILHSVLLSVATLHAQGPRGTATDDPPPTWAVVRRTGPDRGDVVAAAMRTPHHRIALSSLPEYAAEPLAAALLDGNADAPGVAGRDEDVARFVTAWVGRTGQRAEVTMAQRIFRLDRVEPPAPDRRPDGAPRLATDADAALLVDWMVAFSVEAEGESGVGEPSPETRQNVAERIAGGRAYVWENPIGAPVCFVGTSPVLAGIARIGPVYTPPNARGRGYATALTAWVSQTALDSGADATVLYTDLANPTSNKIYQAIGYRPVCDVAVYGFLAD